MFEVWQTETYKKWFKTLRDRKARARIDIRIKRISMGNLGDVKSVGKGVFELRIDYGPGYRVYFVERNEMRIILLAGGKKSTQRQDIQKAQELAQSVEDYK
jgi:putative addiction module killer protein